MAISRRKKAYKDCAKHGDGFEDGHWAGWKPREIVDFGREEGREVGVLFKNEGGIDKRCAAYKRHEVYEDDFGRVQGMREKINELRDLHGTRKHGALGGGSDIDEDYDYQGAGAASSHDDDVAGLSGFLARLRLR